MNGKRLNNILLGIVLVLSFSTGTFQTAKAGNTVASPHSQGQNQVYSPGSPEPEVSQSLSVVETIPLRDMKAPEPDFHGSPKEEPNKPLWDKFGADPRPADPSLVFDDPRLPPAAPASSAVQTVRSFDGLTNVDNAATVGGMVAPPDTDGAVGPNHYIQMVNLIWAVYDKDTGAVLGGPWPGNILWDAANTGDACENTNDGDPVVLYDQLADRWLISQFALPNYPSGPFYECIGISTTGDPLGSWNLYTFQVSATKMNDYPKLGIWPDGYYMAVNQFNPSWAGQGVVAFERAEMLTGSAATMVYFDLYGINPALGGMLPSNLEGSSLPPAGAPNTFAEMDDDAWGWATDQIQFWDFHVDWVTPANSTFTYINTVTTAPFDTDLCGYSRDCIPQPGTTQKVDAIPDRLMYSLQYRNFGGSERMVVNHTVDVDGTDHAGVRWYEFRKTGTWGIYQQGDYAPDSDHRWMGSMSMDGAGNIALGYATSSSTTYPSVHFTGRLAGDALGTMTQGENSIVDGTGAQLGVNRWGDYSMMDVDPVDDCTFWYTQEYIKTTGAWNWATRIGAFKLPGCGATWGSLSGTVTSGATPIDGALVTITGGAYTYTDANGDYSFAGLPAGSYDMTVNKYGYNDGSASSVAVSDGNATDQDFNLSAKPMVTVSGTVKDGSQTGLPLYAQIDIPEYPGSPIFTDPITGAYSVSLEQGSLHNFYVNSTGYNEGTASVTTAGSSMTQNFLLTVDAVSCSAPYYAYTSGYSADMASLTGWTVVDNAGTGLVWDLSSAWGDSNYTGGTGDAAEASSDTWGNDFYDTELVSPVFTTASLPGYDLSYLANFQNYAGLDYLDVDIKVDGGSWSSLLSWNEDHGSLYNTPGEGVSLDLSSEVAGSTSFQLRWRYYDPTSTSAPWNWYAQVDDVEIGACNAVPTTFADVPYSHSAWRYIEAIYDAGITGGCTVSPLNYCPNNTITRAQMAVFLLRGIHGSGYTPPAATGTMFGDVPIGLSTAPWIEQLANEGITSGCGGGNYCPNAPVTRGQMAVFLLRAKYTSAYTPPAATGTMFGDVPIGLSTAAWIEQLANEGITSGCGGGNYCPNTSVSRAQMAVFITRAFSIPLP